MKLAVAGGKSIEVSAATFGRDFSEPLVHQVVTAYLAGARAGTKAQKNRSAARGGGRKPWRQKGTGRARAGTIRSPIWRGGGRAFAAAPRDHAHKVNRKMYRGAMQAILSELVRQDRLTVVDRLELSEPRSRLLKAQLNDMGMDTGLLVTAELDQNLYLASRNLPGIHSLDVAGLDPVSLVTADRVIMTVDAVSRIQEWLG
ncbi:MAG: 50S ribosomal protein L4 [Xanthomonadales bacterium]|nr:50S ribosomal protein L4 [Xanthomonadales bacterium]NIN59369.1 50S ribosomal protein L4 [Xanthomonadales bacterium]NIN74720.1 50S ribosomal protein L4 [Xanthomonadales bacterium]NIO12620.1 50S ribosomal protein L4 [Xanthomonadales bacterium]NIP11762.1 50S ribosomal protein L4 [Xanthomonadales bacterium]